MLDHNAMSSPPPRDLRRPLTVLWDGSKVHGKSKVVRAFLVEHPEIVAEDLPAYAPEINPDELVWSWSKHGRLANLAAEDTDELPERVIDELIYLQKHPHLLAWFLEKTKLPLSGLN
jgi:hypothetical protein